jgi:decaprenyl-phosphate phosphoribosyltransferase
VTKSPLSRTSSSLAWRSLVRAMRPRQWGKNLLVYAAPAAAGLLNDVSQWVHATEAFVAFCAASSATYLLNDVADIEADRRHPTKRFRPIAAGVVPVKLAKVAAALLIVAAFAVMALTGQPMAVGYVAIYLIITLAYSAGLKHVAVVDLILVASGFVVRALAGAKAVDVVVSDWFLIVITFGSLFVVAGKRFAELRELGSGETRATLETYTVPYLRMVVGVGLTGTAISYCLFAFERAGLETHEFPGFRLSIVPVIAALLRYALVLEDGGGGAPEEVFLADRWLQLFGLIWAALFAIGVYT